MQKLKPEFASLDPKELSIVHTKNHVEVSTREEVPVFVYLGDTTDKVFEVSAFLPAFKHVDVDANRQCDIGVIHQCNFGAIGATLALIEKRFLY